MIGKTIGKSGAARWTKILLASTIPGNGAAGIASVVALSVAMAATGGISPAFALDPNDTIIDTPGTYSWSTGQTFQDDLIIGLENKGIAATVRDGAKIYVQNRAIIAGLQGSQATLTVSGPGSELNVVRTNSILGNTLYVGGGCNGYSAFCPTGGDGTLTIENGGKADAKSTYVGDGQYSRGNLVVTGKGSLLNTDTFRVRLWPGSTGSTVTIGDGGSIVTNYVSTDGGFRDKTKIGSKLLVTGEGSKWVNTGDFDLGSDMTVENGGFVSTSGLRVASDIISENTLYITGDKSSVNVTGELSLSSANVSVANGANLNVLGGVDLSGGNLTIGGKISMGDNGTDPALFAPQAAGHLNKEAVLTFGSRDNMGGRLNFNHTGSGESAYEFSNTLVGNGVIRALAGETTLTGDLTKFYSTNNNLEGGIVVDGDGAKLTFKSDFGMVVTDTSNNSGYATNMLVRNGTLVLGGQTGRIYTNFLGSEMYTSSATVSEKGRLEGFGTIGGLTLYSGAVLSPGTNDSRTGTFVVKGRADFGAGSFYDVDIASNGTSDKVVVETLKQYSGFDQDGNPVTVDGLGTARIGADVNVRVTALNDAVSYQTGQTYTILTAAGGIEGQFAQAV